MMRIGHIGQNCRLKILHVILSWALATTKVNLNALFVPLIELMRIVVGLWIVEVKFNFFWFFFRRATSALRLPRWTNGSKLLLSRGTDIIVCLIKLELLPLLQRIVLCRVLNDIGHCVMLLLMRCAFRLFFVADAPVHFLLLAITALVLFDFGSDLSSWILCQIRIANQLQLKQILHWLFELCFNLCSNMTTSFDSLLQ